MPVSTGPDLRAGGPLAQPGPAAANPLLALAADDPSLHAAALGRNAHVRLETGKDGDLSMHLMVRDGVVDVRFDGAASRTLDLRSHEVRTALAGEGMALGQFEATASATHAGSALAPASDGSAGSATASAGATFSAHSGQPDGGGQPSNGGAGFGGGNRHSDAGDRWPDRQQPSTAGPAPSGKPGTEPRRRRGFHVTA